MLKNSNTKKIKLFDGVPSLLRAPKNLIITLIKRYKMQSYFCLKLNSFII